ncbi:Pyridoxamine 5'-phosphate oxidase [Nocardioides lianchengensis]|uniref:Pyridoxamine 5'-phosphate oxidase n=2 Tax=Nocardioides lianchengensis TaxID=1045774 RepID=A0A1G6YJY7_9ACTN|nr:hypothetical protein [Nocardioides lianchengensis]SDD90650.1 Pyridoxamine 5'-phosphate oxidase [Nocardioides lianchengensis]
MNYTVVGDAVLMRTRVGSALAELLDGRSGEPAAFEVDGLDHADQVGWSVQACGPLEVVAAGSAATADQGRPVRPWAPGEREVVVRLGWRELTGRRLGTGWDPLQRPAYRRVD